MATPQTCIECKKQTVSVISTPEGPLCYQCFSEKKNPSKKGKKHDKPEERMQIKFFNQVPLFFPKLPDKLLFAVPNGGSRNIVEAKNLKAQGVKSGVSDVILLIPKKGYSCLCLEFKTPISKQSDEQITFQSQAEKAGNKYVVVRSVKEAIDALKWYLE
uniref:VRR-NUC domain-containing protein n=1 Tax=uncultured Dysgonomonas sp. TaxID=206096 RepID=UPI0026189E23|nr:VRR-NUC domain-containing protein [uncultured Dysgonomonas sp.]